MGASAASLVSIVSHEAGHAVAAWHGGLKIHRATTIPTPGRLGHVKHASPQPRHGASDHERAGDLAMRVNSSDRAVEVDLAWLTIVASDELVERRTLSQAEIAACCFARTALAASGRAERQPPLPNSRQRPSLRLLEARPMTDAGEEFLRLLALKDARFAGIRDEALDGILVRKRADFIRVLRATMDEIGQLSDAGPGCEARRNAQVAWLGEVLAALDPAQ
jgi:hypothetical protein